MFYWLDNFTYRLFGWLLPVARVHEPGRREPGFRDATNLLASAEPGLRCVGDLLSNAIN
jgi:hypothetical protein